MAHTHTHTLAGADKRSMSTSTGSAQNKLPYKQISIESRGPSVHQISVLDVGASRSSAKQSRQAASSSLNEVFGLSK